MQLIMAELTEDITPFAVPAVTFIFGRVIISIVLSFHSVPSVSLSLRLLCPVPMAQINESFGLMFGLRPTILPQERW